MVLYTDNKLNMIFYLFIFFNIVLTSFFLFPIGFSFMPSGLNTKIMMALMGGGLFLLDIKQLYIIPNYIFGVFLFGILFSCASLFSVFYNETSDYTYAGYFLSMSVWLSSAYFLLRSFKLLHQSVTFCLIVNYLIVVCIIQCLLALLIDMNVVFKQFIDTYIIQIAGGVEFLNEVNRLYGIGAALDPAGVRFAAVLLLIAVIMNTETKLSRSILFLYTCLFLVLFALGNLLSRTTTVGGIIGVVYLIWRFIIQNLSGHKIKLGVMGLFLLALILVSFLGILVYTKMEDMQILIRYGFEAFFNWFEYGELTTASTEKLNTMWVFPDNLKTWIIGDGWFNDPISSGYYKYTDIGYLRFIFYCGLIGLFLFSFFFLYISYILSNSISKYSIAFYLLLLLGFVVWVKVSTDLFQIYALFIVLASFPSGLKKNNTT